MSENCELLVVLPVYNERASLRKVISDWFEEIKHFTPNFTLLAIDDGSADGSASILRELAASLGSRLEIITQTNCGHGQTCLRGYRMACERNIPYVFQIDSDGQCDPQYFHKF